MIYYWAREDEVVLLLLMYGKNEPGDLSPQQRTILKRLVEEEFS